MAKLSSYAENLPQEARTRYLAKISTIGGVDPFLGANSASEACSQLPALDTCDLVSYMVLKTCFITATQSGGLQPVCLRMGQGCNYKENIRKISHLCSCSCKILPYV